MWQQHRLTAAGQVLKLYQMMSTELYRLQLQLHQDQGMACLADGLLGTWKRPDRQQQQHTGSSSRRAIIGAVPSQAIAGDS